jgi:hypothetical protein
MTVGGVRTSVLRPDTGAPGRARLRRACVSGSAKPSPKNTHVKKIHMANAVDDRPVNLKAFAELPADTPVVMINLLKLRW